MENEHSVSFIHRGGPVMASFRYRAAIPAKELGATLNNLDADYLVFSKPQADEIQWMRAALDGGQYVVVDFCDDHFDRFSHYQEALNHCSAAVTPTIEMARLVSKHNIKGVPITVIPDPYEYPEVEPHCQGNRLLWFGHGVNIKTISPWVKPLQTAGFRLSLVSNVPYTKPWSFEAMFDHFNEADVVILPATAAYKSCNRAVEAIRQGCFVVAESHPSLDIFTDRPEPNIWIGNLMEGVQWATKNHLEANKRTKEAQKLVSHLFAPKTLASAWKSLFQLVKLRSTSDVGESDGLAGLVSISLEKV